MLVLVVKMMVIALVMLLVVGLLAVKISLAPPAAMVVTRW